MKTLHITELKCEEVQNVTLTRQFFRIKILGILHDFAIISFRQNTQLNEILYFFRRKTIQTHV